MWGWRSLPPCLLIYLGTHAEARWPDPGSLSYACAVQTMVLSHCKRLKHVEALWFSGVANNILWWTFAKAFFNSFLAKLGVPPSMRGLPPPRAHSSRSGSLHQHPQQHGHGLDTLAAERCGSAGKQITFKATLKGMGGRLAASAFIDLWMPVLCFILMAVSLGIGVGKVVSGPTVVTTLSISVCWIIYGMVPPFLLIHYAFIGRGATLAFWSR